MKDRSVREVWVDEETGMDLYRADMAHVVLSKLGRGYTVAVACAAAGISAQTYTSWKRHHAEFREKADRAVADSEQELVDRMIAHADNDWRAAKFLLERRFRHWNNMSYTTPENRDAIDRLKIEKSKMELEYIRMKMDALARLKEPEGTVTVLEVLTDMAQIEHQVDKVSEEDAISGTERER
jgi:DNA-binding helix-hairpin-helix protein with protein kinase domain